MSENVDLCGTSLRGDVRVGIVELCVPLSGCESLYAGASFLPFIVRSRDCRTLNVEVSD